MIAEAIAGLLTAYGVIKYVRARFAFFILVFVSAVSFSLPVVMMTYGMHPEDAGGFIAYSLVLAVAAWYLRVRAS